MRAIIALSGTLVLSLLLAVEYPDVMVKPGRLSEGHGAMNRDCMKCHVLFSGARPEKCTSCHRPEQIGRRRVDGSPAAAAGSAKVLFHESLSNGDCAGCHVVHFSERARREPAAFRHDFLAAEVRARCDSCHADVRPADALHLRAGSICAACHTTGGWAPASFDHRQVASHEVNCSACHQKDRPGDDLHRQSGDDCRACHGTERWAPSTFDHSRYFRFDRNHPADCTGCHTAGERFKSYTCYGCHEHSPAKVAAEHLEEGVTDFENCVRCHRGGDGDSGREEDDH